MNPWANLQRSLKMLTPLVDVHQFIFSNFFTLVRVIMDPEPIPQTRCKYTLDDKSIPNYHTHSHLVTVEQI